MGADDRHSPRLRGRRRDPLLTLALLNLELEDDEDEDEQDERQLVVLASSEGPMGDLEFIG